MKPIFRCAVTLPLLCLLLGTAAGCAEFRRAFSSPDPSLERNAPPRQAQKKRSSKVEDPLFDRVFHNDDRHPGTQSELLTEQERSLVNSSVGSSAASDPAVQGIYEQGERSRTRNKDWVFGTKDGSYFR